MRCRWRALVWLCSLGTGCLRIGYEAPGGERVADLAPLIDRAAVDGSPSLEARLCTPGTRRCSDGARLTCASDGMRELREPCELGCAPDACVQLVPSNGVVGETAAAGGTGNTDEGWGGAGSLKAGAGSPAVPGADNGGGGGGGAGRIRINARSLSRLGAQNGADTQGELASRLAP